VSQAGDQRWSGAPHVDAARESDLAREIAEHYPQLGRVAARLAYSSVHDMVEVTADAGRFAVKLYRAGLRSPAEVQWEVDLHRHLLASGAPVARPHSGVNGFVELLHVDGAARMAVLAEWAPGAKPSPGEHTFRLLGRAAAAIHAAADEFTSTLPRVPRTVHTEVRQYVARLRPLLEDVDRWDDAVAAAKTVERVLSSGLERGICHADLTLDNVHIDGDTITVFDFDNAAEHWRSWEPHGVYALSVITSRPWWDCWRAGYAEIRTMAEEDERAVPYFQLMAEFEHTAWKLGLTPTSVAPSLRPDDLPGIVDGWTEWAHTQCAEL
jgi:Ser/Thr protein kinase RdoA (MazF antagonist)